MRSTMARISSTTLGASPRNGSSIISSRGRAISPRAIATICCWPPTSCPRADPSARRAAGRGSPPRRATPRAAPVPSGCGRRAADLTHRERREESPALEHVAEAARDDRMRRDVGEVLAPKLTRPARRGKRGRGVHDRALAGAVRPQAHDFARPHFERDAPQHLEVVVDDLERLDAQQRLSGHRVGLGRRDHLRVRRDRLGRVLRQLLAEVQETSGRRDP